MQKQLSIITVNYNGLKDTCELIDTIPFDDYSLEVIVVDNGSKVDEAVEIKKRYPHVIVIRSEQNLGFAGGNNLGIKEAKGKYLYFINNDTLIYQGENREKAKNSLQALIDRLESSDKIGVVCPKIYFSWEEKLIQFAGYTPLSRVTIRNRAIGCGEKDKGQHDTPHPTPYAHGAAMMVRRKAVDKAGLMPECYFLYQQDRIVLCEHFTSHVTACSMSKGMLTTSKNTYHLYILYVSSLLRICSSICSKGAVTWQERYLKEFVVF